MDSSVKDTDLGNIWLFSACRPNELRRIRKAVEEVTVPAGRELCSEASMGKEFFLILRGRASVVRRGRKIATLGPGQYFGELSLLDKQPRSASVVADTEMHLLVMEYRRFHGILDEMPSIATRLLSAMAVRLRGADAKAFANS